MTPLPRAQQDAIRASTRNDPRWLADVTSRQRLAATRRDRWYEMVTRGDGGRVVRSKRQGRDVIITTSCTTTYSNVSGTYDTSTDPILSQTCSTTMTDDGGSSVLDGGGGGTDPNLVAYGEPWSNFDTTTEKACKTSKAKFISLSKNATDNGQVPSPGQTVCGPKTDNDYLQLTGGRIFYSPGDCQFTVTLTSRNISVNPLSGNTGLLTETSTNDGIR
ncbi:MAG: hypothetical protein JO103_04705, partial [Candidatus Eremiobacteraeota bacterium]|nr:hypothetical protein [Candidatus Eremiobacteraeota bacterium]MBV9408398.1 hypothetical protein [Candidatus Eremiobacteraeota bacterium]